MYGTWFILTYVHRCPRHRRCGRGRSEPCQSVECSSNPTHTDCGHCTLQSAGREGGGREGVNPATTQSQDPYPFVSVIHGHGGGVRVPLSSPVPRADAELAVEFTGKWSPSNPPRGANTHASILPHLGSSAVAMLMPRVWGLGRVTR